MKKGTPRQKGEMIELRPQVESVEGHAIDDDPEDILGEDGQKNPSTEGIQRMKTSLSPIMGHISEDEDIEQD